MQPALTMPIAVLINYILLCNDDLMTVDKETQVGKSAVSYFRLI
jgi:hypothetical protein